MRACDVVADGGSWNGGLDGRADELRGVERVAGGPGCVLVGELSEASTLVAVVRPPAFPQIFAEA